MQRGILAQRQTQCPRSIPISLSMSLPLAPLLNQFAGAVGLAAGPTSELPAFVLDRSVTSEPGLKRKAYCNQPGGKTQLGEFDSKGLILISQARYDHWRHPQVVERNLVIVRFLIPINQPGCQLEMPVIEIKLAPFITRAKILESLAE